jgi:O-antigen/teichoic acid export membrane protein
MGPSAPGGSALPAVTVTDTSVKTIDTGPAGTSRATPEPHNRRRIAANFLVMSTASALILLIGLFTSAYSRRVLGPIAIGQVSWSAAVLTYLGLFASPGLQMVGQRAVARNPGDAAHLTSVVLTLQTLFALAAYVVVFVIAGLDLRGPEISILLLLQSASLLIAALDVRWVLQAHERMVGPSIANLVVNAAQVPALIALVHSPEDVFVYVIFTVPFSLAGIAYNFWYLRHQGLLRLRQLRPSLAGAKRLLTDSWPFALSQGAILLYYNCDAIILGFTQGDAAVGLYSTAYKLMLVSAVISGAMWNAYFPVLTRAQSVPSDAARIASEFATLLAWMGLPMAALAWACGRHVVVLMYGPEYADAGRYFEWLCLNIGLVFLNVGLGMPLLTWGFQRLQLWMTAPVGLANLALNLVVIPVYGAWGAVATTLAAEFVIFFLTIRARWRIGIGWHPILPIITAPILCSAVVALGIAALPRQFDEFWWIEFPAGAAVLGGCVLVFERRILAGALALLRRG